VLGIAVTLFGVGAGLADAGLWPDIDSPPLSRLGLLVMLTSTPAWVDSAVRRASLLNDEQLDYTFRAGYDLCSEQFRRAAADRRLRDATGRHDR
jgi:hypothetical protein